MSTTTEIPILFKLQEVAPILKKEIAGRAVIRKNDKIKIGIQLLNIPYDSIEIRPGFNVRKKLGNLEELADLIEGPGLLNPITVDVLTNGKIYLNDGERRWRAYGLLRQRTPEHMERFSHMQAFANPSGTTELSRIIKMLSSATGAKSLEEIEQAEGFARMLLEKNPNGSDVTNADIARYVGMTRQHVGNILKLAGISEEEKQMIMDGDVSATAISKMVQKGMKTEERVERIQEAKDSGSRLKVEDIYHRPEKTFKSDSALKNALNDLLTDNAPADPPKEEETTESHSLTHPNLLDPYDESKEDSDLIDKEEAQYAGANTSQRPRAQNLVDVQNSCLAQAQGLKTLLMPMDGSDTALDLLHKLTENLRIAKKMADALQ